MNFELLKKLCAFFAASGDEDNLRSFILEEIKNYVKDVRIDTLGNLIVKKEGLEKCKTRKKFLLTAHMDEVGFIVTHITAEGFLKFSTVGSINSKVLLGTRVLVGEKRILGVIGSTPIHLLKSEEKFKDVSVENMYIDIGAKNKDNALKYVNLGDYAYFEPVFFEDENNIKSKALDNRLGCFVLINLIKRSYPYDIYFAFTTREEIGAVGAKTMAYSLNPDISIVVDSTTASDIHGVDEDNKVCMLEKGPVVPFMDLGTVYNKELYTLAFKLANENKIPIQTKEAVAGGTDASSIHSVRCGVRTLGISIPCRYIHSPVSLCKKIDLKNTEKLLESLILKISENAEISF